MSQDTLAWVQGAEGRGILIALHIAGMMLLSCSVIGSFLMAGRMLFWRGPRPGRTFLGLVHGSLAVALAGLWASGGGLVIGGNALADWPDQLTLKLAVAGALTLSLWVAHVVVLPLLHSRRRPLVDALGWRALLAVIVTQTVLLSCWAMLIAHSFSDAVRGMPLARASALLGGVVAALAVAWLLVAVIARATRAQAGARGERKSKGRRRHSPTRRLAQPRVLQQPSAPQPELREAPYEAQAPRLFRSDTNPAPGQGQVVAMPAPAPQAVPASAAHRAHVSAAAELQQLRDKLATEWFRGARSPAGGSNPAAGFPPAERQRPVQDWLRRPVQR